MTGLRISELSRRTGVPTSTLRYYDDLGLLPAPERTPAGYRLYDERAQQRLVFIEAAKRLKLSLAAIGDLLTSWESDACRAVKGRLCPALDERIAEADTAIADLQRVRDHLQSARVRLDDLPDSNDPCDPRCVVLLSDQSVHEKSPACSLDGDQYRDRTEQWRAVVAGGLRSRVPGGLEVTLPVQRAPELTALIVAEQTCCGFLDFALRFEGASVVMTLTGPENAQQAIADFIRGL